MMKLSLLCMLTMCIWLGQTCAGSDETITKQIIREQIYDVSEQFVDDIVLIEEQFQDNNFIQYTPKQTISLISRDIPTQNNSKIDVNQVKAYAAKINLPSVFKKIVFDQIKITQLILSKQLPPERYNGILNLYFVCYFDCATTDEIQSALNYLYGIDTEATKISFLDSHNLPKVTSEDECLQFLRFSPKIDELSRLVDVKPKVKQDFLAIRDQFTCHGFARVLLEDFIFQLQRLGGEERKISACMIIENPGRFLPNREMERFVKTAEALLSTRLPDETFRGIIKFQRIILPGTPIDEIEKALEYFYDDVPRSECPTAEGSTLKAY